VGRALVSDDDWIGAFTRSPEGALSEEEVEWITGRTAAAFYGLD